VLGAESRTLHRSAKRRWSAKPRRTLRAEGSSEPSRGQRDLFAHLTGRGLIGVVQPARTRVLLVEFDVSEPKPSPHISCHLDRDRVIHHGANDVIDRFTDVLDPLVLLTYCYFDPVLV